MNTLRFHLKLEHFTHRKTTLTAMNQVDESIKHIIYMETPVDKYICDKS